MQKRMEAAIKGEEAHLKDRGYKYLAIANPANGEEFFEVLYKLNWEESGMVKITRDKLYCLASSKIPKERYIDVLDLVTIKLDWIVSIKTCFALVFCECNVFQKENSFATNEPKQGKRSPIFSLWRL